MCVCVELKRGEVCFKVIEVSDFLSGWFWMSTLFEMSGDVCKFVRFFGPGMLLRLFHHGNVISGK